jgi:Putative prokaryotic signal transducing protein
VSLVPVVRPDSEAELTTIVAMLEARGVPCFVRGGGIGSLLPGVQVESFNARAIMVPEDRANEAIALIADLRGSADDGDDKTPPPPPPSKLRTLAEFLLFGWFVPGRRDPKR